jgi:hypothetical protein
MVHPCASCRRLIFSLWKEEPPAKSGNRIEKPPSSSGVKPAGYAYFAIIKNSFLTFKTYRLFLTYISKASPFMKIMKFPRLRKYFATFRFSPHLYALEPEIASGNGLDAHWHHHFIGRWPCGRAHSPVNSKSQRPLPVPGFLVLTL